MKYTDGKVPYREENQCCFSVVVSDVFLNANLTLVVTSRGSRGSWADRYEIVKSSVFRPSSRWPLHGWRGPRCRSCLVGVDAGGDATLTTVVAGVCGGGENSDGG